MSRAEEPVPNNGFDGQLDDKNSWGDEDQGHGKPLTKWEVLKTDGTHIYAPRWAKVTPRCKSQ